jgi:signal peptidase I
MGYNPFFSFIPFYNYFIILKETNHPKNRVSFILSSNSWPIMMSAFHIFLMRKFGKRGFVNGLLTVLLPFIFMATVNYGKDPEIETEEEEEEGKKKETFWVRNFLQWFLQPSFTPSLRSLSGFRRVLWKEHCW